MAVRWSLRLAIGLVVVMLVGLGVSPPVSAGGNWFDPVKDRYEPGEEVTLVGYTGGGLYGWVDDGPFFGFLMNSTEAGDIDFDGMRLPLGEIELEETGRSGYLSLRASIKFLLPEDLEPGLYWFDYCNTDCSERLGDLIGGLIYVGIDPDYPISREWPLDDPEVANLAAVALLSGPGFNYTAGEIQDGSIEVGTNGLAIYVRPASTTVPSNQTTSALPDDEVAAVVLLDPSEQTASATTQALASAEDDDENSSMFPWGAVGAITLVGAIAGSVVISRRRGEVTAKLDGRVTEAEAPSNEPTEVAR